MKRGTKIVAGVVVAGVLATGWVTSHRSDERAGVAAGSAPVAKDAGTVRADAPASPSPTPRPSTTASATIPPDELTTPVDAPWGDTDETSDQARLGEQSEEMAIPRDARATGVSDDDAIAANQLAAKFVQRAWTFGPSDTTPRAGLARALKLATPHLAAKYKDTLADPDMGLGNWAWLRTQHTAYRAQIGFTSPGPTNEITPTRYVAIVSYDVDLASDTYPGGIPLGGDSRFATIVLTRASTSSPWKVSALPDAGTSGLVG